MSWGAMMVTVLPCDGIVPGTTNCLQVIAEIQEMRSTSSVFGFRFSFSLLLSGSLRHESPPPDAVPAATSAASGLPAARTGDTAKAITGSTSRATNLAAMSRDHKQAGDQHHAPKTAGRRRSRDDGVANLAHATRGAAT